MDLVPPLEPTLQHLQKLQAEDRSRSGRWSNHTRKSGGEGSFVTASDAGSHPPVELKEDTPLNNNNNRGSNRRRGRGNNNRQQGGNQGNRIDSRARGNAPQMLEKYRKLAHDASLNGDRVQA